MRKLLQFFCSVFLTVHVFAAEPIPSDLVGEWRTTTSLGDDYGALYIRSDGFALIMGSKPVPIGAGGPVSYDSNTRTLMLSLREGGAELARITFLHDSKTGLLTATMNGTTMSYQHVRKELPSDLASAMSKARDLGGVAAWALGQKTMLRGEEARPKISQQVRSLPQKATSLFYYRNDGLDFDMYLSFSCSKADCQAVLDELTADYQLKSRAARLPEDVQRLGAPNHDLQPNDWEPSNAKAGTFAEGDTVRLFIDTDQNRVFLRRWST